MNWRAINRFSGAIFGSSEVMSVGVEEALRISSETPRPYWDTRGDDPANCGRWSQPESIDYTDLHALGWNSGRY